LRAGKQLCRDLAEFLIECGQRCAHFQRQLQVGCVVCGQSGALGQFELRGNIDTRLSKIPDGGAIVMAVAALDILAMTDRIAERLDVDTFVPAVGQGCVAVECRVDDLDTHDAVVRVDDAPTRHAVEVERAFLGQLGSGCSLPVGGHVRDERLTVFLADDAAGQSIIAGVDLVGGDEDLAIARRAARGAQEALR